MLEQIARSSNPRVAILGIGNELNGDDSAGVWVARKLKVLLKSQPDFFVYDCGTIPENATGPLRKFVPGLVIMVDAADLGESPGSIRFIDFDQVGGFSASSHTLPFSVLAKYLSEELDCELQLLCIQPKSLEFNSKPTISVKPIVNEFVRCIQSA